MLLKKLAKEACKICAIIFWEIKFYVFLWRIISWNFNKFNNKNVSQTFTILNLHVAEALSRNANLTQNNSYDRAVLHTGIRIRRIDMVLGIKNPDTGPLVRGKDLDPIKIKKIVRKTLIPTVFWLLFDFLSLKNDVNVHSKSNEQKNPDPDLLARGMDPRIRNKMWLRTPPECLAAGRPLLGGWPAGVHGPDRPSSPPPRATPAYEKWSIPEPVEKWIYCLIDVLFMLVSSLCTIYKK